MRQILDHYYIQYNMENQQSQNQRTLPLTVMLSQFLREPSPQIEHQLTRFSAPEFLTIISDRSQSKDIRVAAITAFKGAASNREAFQGVVVNVQDLYLSMEEELCPPLQMLLEYMFQLYLDDEKKLGAFERVVDTLSNNPNINASKTHQRALRIALLLVRGMAASSLNNQICIGGLVCYLKQLYYTKNKTNDPSSVSGRGMELLVAAMSNPALDPSLGCWLQVQVTVVQLMREIVLRVEEEESEQPQVLPSLYLSRSHEIQSLLSGIISASVSGKLLCTHQPVNHLKAQLLQLYSQTYLYRINQSFLVAALSTITSLRASSLQDYSQQSVSTLLLLIERSTSHPDYAQQFFSITQTLVLKLFEFVASGNAEKDALENDPQYFAEIADDFCKTQDAESIKSRAGSLLYNLAMYVDGNLTFIANLALLPLFDLERRALAALRPQIPPRPESIQSQAPMKTFLQLWPLNAESITETSILILASISDLLAKRVEFNATIRAHLGIVLPLFSLKEQTLSFFPTIVICRYLQLVSFFSAPNCLDSFIGLYSAHPAIAQSLLRSLQTVIHFYDKKDEQMGNYVSKVSTQVLLLSDTLTPLLQTTIISRPELLLCVKERLLEKLVLWLLKYLQNVNVFASNKIGNLICKLLEKYPDYLIQSEQQLYIFQLQALAQYLSPLYRHLLTSQKHQAQECVIEVAVSHCQILKTALSPQVAMQFFQLGVSVVTRNNFVLNKCLQLFSRLLSTPHANLIPLNIKQQLVHTWLTIANDLLPLAHIWLSKVERRDQNIWQIAYLFEIVLAAFSCMHQTPSREFLNFSLLLDISKSMARVVQVKATMVSFLAVMLDQGANPSEQWLGRGTLPLPLPPYESNRICILAIRSLPRFGDTLSRSKILNYILALLLPSPALRKYFAVYADELHCSNPHECQIFAFQAQKEVLHPLSCWPSDPFQQLRVMLDCLSGWREVAAGLGQQGERRLREALSMRVVGSKLRRIVKVKPLKLS